MTRHQSTVAKLSLNLLAILNAYSVLLINVNRCNRWTKRAHFRHIVAPFGHMAAHFRHMLAPSGHTLAPGISLKIRVFTQKTAIRRQTTPIRQSAIATQPHFFYNTPFIRPPQSLTETAEAGYDKDLTKND